MLSIKRRSDQYQRAFPEYGQSSQQAFPEYGQSSQQTMSLQEQMLSKDQGRLLRTSSPEETGYASGSDTQPQYDRFSTINKNRKETLKEFAYNLIITDNKTRPKRVTKNENEFDFVVECLREHLPDWKTTDQHTYREAHQRLLG
jgi:hypothetical protein